MLKTRNLRALVTINPISLFYSHGHPKGMLYEQLEQLERFVNNKYKTRRRKVKVSFIPMRPDQLGPSKCQEPRRYGGNRYIRQSADQLL
jgi:hypothetical protein